MEAPASAAAMASSAISLGVRGKCSDMVGVCIDPVTAQVMMTFPSLAIIVSSLKPVPYLMACGLIGEPTPRVMGSGGPQKKNS